MQHKWKLIATTAALLCATVHADDGDSSSSYGNKRASKMQMMKQGDIITSDQMQSGYNAPAAVNPNGDWDMYITGSYLLWDFFQDGMDIGKTYSAGTPSPAAVGVQRYDDEYKSAFQVGLGWNTEFDNWVVGLEYTWFHHAYHSNQSDPLLSANILGVAGGGSSILISSNSTWKMHMDVGDFFLSRPYYLGTHLTVLPFYGIRGAWIRQNEGISGVATDGTNTFATTAAVSSKSWAVGPRVGTGMYWLLGEGFRIEGDASASLLFTQYKRAYSESPQGDASNGAIASQENQNTVRPNAEASFGFAWGDYLDNQSFHLDIGLVYTFNMWWSQNMGRDYVNSLNRTNTQNPGDLYLHGLTAYFKFDF